MGVEHLTLNVCGKLKHLKRTLQIKHKVQKEKEKDRR